MKVIRNKLRTSLILMTVLPIIMLGGIFVLFGINTIKTCIETEVMSSLEGVCLRLRDEFLRDYKPGDSSVYTDAEPLLDRYKENFNTEVTVFFDDVRVLTTIRNENNERIIGTRQQDKRVLQAIRSGNKFTASDVDINGEQYNVCYIPIYEDDAVVGMVFAGISNANVRKSIKTFSRQFISVTILVVMLIAFIVLTYSSQLANRLTSIKEYLGTLVEDTNVEAAMDDEMLNRPDEVGDLARYAVKVGGQLTSIMGRDPLTGLYNRRSGRHFLDELHDAYLEKETEYTLVMCDIDHFKNVNDTYGHDTGDKVLKGFSKVVSEMCSKCPGSFAIRWGGEEILMGFKLSQTQTVEVIEKIKEHLNAMKFESGNDRFSISATFGIETCRPGTEIHDIIVAADEKLYMGKENGRNRIEV